MSTARVVSQSFNGVVRPFGDARPAWKVLRVLGNLLALPGFDQARASRCETKSSLRVRASSAA
jgi:NADH-quinone oxidoreductase subunit G